MSALTQILDTFRTSAVSEREKGNYFENLVKLYLTEEPFYAELYGGKVWLWEDWRKEWVKRGHANPGADAGIDLVAETTDGELHAIQAKFYEETAKLTLDNFGTFFTGSGKKHFSRRLIVHTTTDSTNHLKSALADQYPPVNLISLHDLENSKIDWQAFQPGAEKVALQPLKELRDYQTKAIENVVNGLKEADRGKLIMACGTGKTFTALRLAEQVAGSGGTALFLVPSLNLLSQTLTEWTQESVIPLHSFAVCSDSEVGKKRVNTGDDFELLAHELQYPATTQAPTLATASRMVAVSSLLQMALALTECGETANKPVTQVLPRSVAYALKESCWTVSQMAMASASTKTEADMTVSGVATPRMAEECSLGLMESAMMGNGKTVN